MRLHATVPTMIYDGSFLIPYFLYQLNTCRPDIQIWPEYNLNQELVYKFYQKRLVKTCNLGHTCHNPFYTRNLSYLRVPPCVWNNSDT